jgi:hypothetical protein
MEVIVFANIFPTVTADFDHNIPQFVEGTHQGSQNLSTQKAMAIRFRNLHTIQRFMIQQYHPYLSTISIATTSS